MILRYLILILYVTTTISSKAQTNQALNMSEVLVYNARFNPEDLRQTEVISNLNSKFLIEQSKTDQEKLTFWINIYNSQMLFFLRDTAFEGVYTNFYKQKNIRIAGKSFSLFDIEHEFIRLGLKNKSLGFKKSKIAKDTTWRKLRPSQFDYRALFLLYKGLYGYPPYQCIENADLEVAYSNALQSLKDQFTPKINDQNIYFDWIKKYNIAPLRTKSQNPIPVLIPTPFAVYIHNYYPKYEGVKFKVEDKNPWLK